MLFNPPVKWAVYGASLVVGSLIFGIHLPIDTAAGVSGILWDAGPELLLRQLTGNLLLGTLFAVVGYYSVLAYMDLKEPTSVPDRSRRCAGNPSQPEE